MNMLQRFAPITAIALALIISSVTVVDVHDIYQYWYLVVCITALGYGFGLITCHSHSSGKGLWLTWLLFAFLNLAHSFIDGFVWDSNIMAVLLHEAIRQPTLYILLFGLLVPFKLERNRLIASSIVIITGMWMLGLALGVMFSHVISTTASIHQYIELSVFLLIGDLLHHLVEEYRKLHNPKQCCH